MLRLDQSYVFVLNILGNFAWATSPPDCLFWEDGACYLESFYLLTFKALCILGQWRICGYDLVIVCFVTLFVLSMLSVHVLISKAQDNRTKGLSSRGNHPPQRKISRPIKELHRKGCVKHFPRTESYDI